MSKRSIPPRRDPGSAAAALMGDTSWLTGASLPERPFGGSGVSSASAWHRHRPGPESLAGSDLRGQSLLDLSTGEIRPSHAVLAGYQGSTQFRHRPPSTGAARSPKTAVLKLDVDVPPAANCLASTPFLSGVPQYSVDYNTPSSPKSRNSWWC